MRIFDTNWMQIEDYLGRDDRVVLPVGSTEQHGFLSLGTDAILAERVSVEAAEPLGIPVLPVLPFGLAPYWTAFPGSMTLRVTTYLAVVRDLLDCLAGEGFRRIAIVNGHGGEPVQVLFHSWFNAPKTALAASRFEPDQLRRLSPDGQMGGAYQRPDADMQAVWDAGVAEVRELLEAGWAR